MLRFAFTPNKDLDINDLRVVIFNYILSKQQNEGLLLRVEDSQKEKILEGKDKEILELLALFSIDYSHVVYQSENLKYHQKLAMQLMSKKKAFACFCGEEKLKELKEYDGFCETLSDETVLNVNSPFTVRIKKDVDSFIILDHNKTPLYDYATSVDDMLSDISTIFVKDDDEVNISKQIHIRNNLNYEKEINYIKLPCIEDGKNKKLSQIKNLVDEGFLPSAIANYLVLLGNETPIEIFSLEEAISWFDIKKLSNETVKFDLKKLKYINKKHLETIDNMRLSKILGFADDDIGKLAKYFIKDSSTINELKEIIQEIFTIKTTCKGFEKEFTLIKKAMKKAPFYENFGDLEKYLIEETKLKDKNLSIPLVYILRGKNDDTNLFDIYPFIKNYLGEIIK